MPITIRFPAPGFPLGKQIITPLSNFSGRGFDGGSFKNILINSENQGSSTWIINTGTVVAPLADGTTVVTYAPKINNATSWYQEYSITSDALSTELVNHGALPVITGVPFVGQLLTVTTGTWYGDSISFSYQWQRGTVNIDGATSSTYYVDPADEKFKLRCLVIATSGAESTISKSTSTAVIAGAPLDTSPPVLSGTQSIGSTLSVTTGTWTADTALTFTYQWYRTNVAITTSTASTYVIQSIDAGYILNCTVRATNTRGAYHTTSSNYTGIISGPPINTFAPIVSGSFVLGSTLSIYDGLWVGYPTPAFTYQWQRGTTDIAGATASTYVSVIGDVASTIRARVTATNGLGSSSTFSNSTLEISTVPANTVAPVTTGNIYVGQTLSVTTGTWTGYPAPTYAYQWKRISATAISVSGAAAFTTPGTYTWTCPAGVTSVNVVCVGAGGGGGLSGGLSGGGGGGLAWGNNIPVTSGTVYTVVVGQGSFNAPGGTSYFSNTNVISALGGSTGTVTGGGQQPAGGTYFVAASITSQGGGNGGIGGAAAGQGQPGPGAGGGAGGYTGNGGAGGGAFLSDQDGSPGTGGGGGGGGRAYGNGNGAGGGGGVGIFGQTSNGAGGIGSTTTNGGGGAGNPVGGGNGGAGGLFALGAGGPGGRGGTAFGGGGGGLGGTAISGTSSGAGGGGGGFGGGGGNGYDNGSTPSTRGQGGAGSGGAVRIIWSNAGQIRAFPSTNVDAAYDNVTYSTTYLPFMSTLSNVSVVSGVGAISGANSSSYLLIPSDYNCGISCTVTGNNQAGSSSADSNTLGNTSTGIGLITQPAQYLTQPVVSGTPTRGQTLSVNTGTWSTNVNLVYAYQWYRSGTAISTGTASTYILADVDLGLTMTASVAATNIAGTTTATSSNSLGPVVGIPVNTVLPVISGTNLVGQTLSVTDGTWTAYPSITYSYQWKRGGTPISLATSNTYLLVSADATYTITCTVTATNSQGSTPVTTNATSSINETVSNTAVPTVSGLLYVGQTLATTTGTWIGTPGPTYTFQWQRVTTPIAGATSSSYVLTTDDVGYTLRSSVTATNVVNSATAYSVQTGSVSGLPYVSVQPLITAGTSPYIPGVVLTVNTGTFLGATPITVTQQWYRVATTGTVAIAGQTSLTYTVTSDDIGMSIQTRSTATNSYGSTSTTSSNSILIPPVIPTNAMIMYNGTDPGLAGWSRYSTADGLVIKGASVQGDIGVTTAAAGTYSAAYTVGLAGLHNGPGNYYFFGGNTPGSASYGPQSNSAGDHSHTFSLTGSAAPAKPPRTQHTLLYATTDQYQFPTNTIHIHANNAGGSWTQKIASGAIRFIVGGNGVSDLAAVAATNNSASSSSDGFHDHIAGSPTRISSSTPAGPNSATPGSATGQVHSHSASAGTVPMTVSSIAGKLMKLWTAASQDTAFNGHVVMFVGTLTALPPYWKLCDGTNGTPDLRTYSLGYSTASTDHNVATALTAQSASLTLSLGSWTHTHAGNAGATPSSTQSAPHGSTNVGSHNHTLAAVTAPLSGYDPGSIKVAFIQYVAP